MGCLTSRLFAPSAERADRANRASNSPIVLETLERRTCLSALPNLTIDIVATTLSNEIVAGSAAKGTVQVAVNLAGSMNRGAKVPIDLSLRPSGASDASRDIPIGSAVASNLIAGKPKMVSVRAAISNHLEGDFDLVATVDSKNQIAESDESDNTAGGDRLIHIVPAFADLSVTSQSQLFGASSRAGAKGALKITLANIGNIPARGKINFNLALRSPTGGSFPATVTTGPLSANIKPGKNQTFHVNLTLPTVPAGDAYAIVGGVSPVAGFVDPDLSDNAVNFSTTPINIEGAPADPIAFASFIAATSKQDQESGTISLPNGESATYQYGPVKRSRTYDLGILGDPDNYVLNNISFIGGVTKSLNGKTITTLPSKAGASGSGHLTLFSFNTGSHDFGVVYFKIT